MKIESIFDRQGHTTIPAATRALLETEPGDRLHWQILGSGLHHTQLQRVPAGRAQSPKMEDDHA